MPDEQLELDLEVFDISRVKGATAKWPKPNKRVRAEEISHPGIIPDLREGPFQPIDGWRDDGGDSAGGWTDDELKSLRDDEEIGYEGER